MPKSNVVLKIEKHLELDKRTGVLDVHVLDVLAQVEGVASGLARDSASDIARAWHSPASNRGATPSGRDSRSENGAADAGGVARPFSSFARIAARG